MFFFEISGTCTTIGEAIGENFRKEIKDYVEYRFQQMNDELSSTGVGISRSDYYLFSQQLLQYAERNSTEELRELAGVARGANIPIEDILFAVGYTDIFDLILSHKGKLSQHLFESNAECTTFICNKDGKIYCGQNWDMDEKSANNCCYFRKHYSDGSYIQGLSTLIGLIHIGVNERGTFVGTANLCSLHNSPSGLVFSMVIQHLLKNNLDPKSMQWLKTVRKVGGHYFYVLQDNAFAVECDATKCVIHEVSGSYAHTNHYREIEFKEYGIAYSYSTIMRCQYMERELLHMDKDIIISLKRILSNHTNNICRHSNGICPRTSSSVIYDAFNNTIHLCDSNPCTGVWSEFKRI